MFTPSKSLHREVVILEGSRSDLSVKERIMLKRALDARRNAYAPYSHFKVGAAVLASQNGGAERIFSGCNVENAAFSPTSCAEVSAIDAAVSEGFRKIKSVLVVSDSEIPAPCGRCRQKIVEFGKDIEVIMASSKNKKVQKTRIRDLLPHSFSLGK
jgi:cytidine deaminase